MLLPLLLASCVFAGGGSQSDGVRNAPRHTVPIKQAAGFFFDVAWLTNGWMLVSYEIAPSKPGSIGEVWRFHPDGTAFQRVALPQDATCRQTEYRFPSALPDGRFTALKTCWAPFDVLPVAQETVVAADAASGATSILADLHNDAHPTHISWDPKLDRAIASDSSGICATMYWLSRQGVEFPSIKIGDGTRSWRLDDPLLRDANRCGDPSLGRAQFPQWSPDGKTIAFVASPQTIGLRDQDRLDAPWNLYVMDLLQQQPRALVTNIRGPSNPAWSPDSHWLAFAGDLPGKGRATWLLAASGGAPVRLTSDDFSLLTWSPDGNEIAGLWDGRKSQYPPISQVVVLDVKSLTK
jgi:WD40 repeat protein